MTDLGTTQPEEYYCTVCGGANMTVEVSYYWDNVTQTFAPFETADEGRSKGGSYCAECGHVSANFRPITDVKTLAQIAIKREEANAATAIA